MTAAEAAMRFLRALETGDVGDADELIAPGYVNHEAAPERRAGPEGFRASVAVLRRMFADLRFEVDDVIEGGDRVVIRCRMTGRHVGQFLGFAGTGRRFSANHIHIFRVVDGKVHEHWACRDDLGMMREVGALPPT